MDVRVFIVILCVQTFLVYADDEPSCPGDLYNVRILERVLETQAEIKDVKEAVEKVLIKLDAGEKLEADTREVERNVNEMATRLETLDKRVRDLELQLLDEGSKHNSGQPVAFSVALGKTTAFNQDDAIIFDHVITNIGNHYDSTSGEFRAPRNGIYMFTANLLTNNGKEIWGYIKAGGRQVKLNAHPSNSRHDQCSQSMVIDLNAGDNVTVSGWPYIYGGFYSSFNGYLIQEF